MTIFRNRLVSRGPMWRILSCIILAIWGHSRQQRPFLIKNQYMKKFAQPIALLATGLLAGVYYYGYFTVIPAFYEVPLKVHLAYRVALMNHNSVYVQSLTAGAILAPIWLALTAKLNRTVRIWSMLAAIVA